MGEYIQQDLFNNSELDLIREEIRVIRQRSDNVRRGLFARYNEETKSRNVLSDRINQLTMLYELQSQEIEKLKAYIYQDSFSKIA